MLCAIVWQDASAECSTNPHNDFDTQHPLVLKETSGSRLEGYVCNGGSTIEQKTVRATWVR